MPAVHARGRASGLCQVHYRRQLEYMKRRLYVNEVAYDAHLNAMEVAMAALHKEYQQVGAGRCGLACAAAEW